MNLSTWRGKLIYGLALIAVALTLLGAQPSPTASVCHGGEPTNCVG